MRTPVSLSGRPGSGEARTLRTLWPCGRIVRGGMAVVTLLLTDLQGSTALWERQPVVMAAALAWHDALVGEVVPAHGGTVVKPRGEGDSIFAIFDDARSASACAIELQRALAGSGEATGIALRVRVAIHTGEVERRDGDFYGPTVNRCARVRGVIHGGQVVLSGAAVEDLGGELPAGAGLMDLGVHLLRDLPDPERLHQLTHPALPASFPPLTSIRPGPDNLPADRGSFVGRDADVTSVTQLLERERVVTLLGPGGVGKTRLAVRVARSLVGRFPAGRWFVDLTGAGEAQPVVGAIASALGLSGEGTSELEQAVRTRLGVGTALLVLDNCEHVVEAAAGTVEGLLEACPDLYVLATSRERLHMYGEQVWRLAPLSVPQDDPTDLEAARRFPAVELFLDRAAAAAPEDRYVDADAALLTSLCRRLDGLPLSLELAAARAHAMTLPQIHAGLDDRLRLLSEGPRGRSPRLQSLEALLGWSYDLLDPKQQRVLRRLGVLQGRFDLPAAAAVAGLPEGEAAAVVERLVECSLVDRRPDDVAPYRLLETIRHYADAKLADEQERASALDGALTAMASLMQALMRSHARTPQRRAQLRAAEPDLRWLLDHAVAGGAEQQALSVSYGIWQTAPDQRESIRAFRRVLALPGGDSVVRGRVLAHAGLVIAGAGEVTQGKEMVEAALSMAQRLDEPAVAARALHCLALMAQDGGADEVRAIALEQLAVAARCEDPWFTAQARTNLGIAAGIAEELEAADAEHRAAIDGYLAAGDHYGVAVSRVNLGDSALVRGALDDAAAHLSAAAVIFRELESTEGGFFTAFGLGSVALTAGDREGSAGHLLEALGLAPLLAWPRLVADLLGCVAAHAAVGARWEEAATALGAADALGLNPDSPTFVGDVPQPDEIQEASREALGVDAAAAATAAGAALPLDSAIAYAIAYLEEVIAAAAQPAGSTR